MASPTNPIPTISNTLLLHHPKLESVDIDLSFVIRVPSWKVDLGLVVRHRIPTSDCRGCQSDMDTSEKNPKNPYDRRDFLKVAAGGVGALVASNAKAQTQSAEAVVAQARRRRFGQPCVVASASARFRFHDRRHQVAGLRVLHRESRRQFPRPDGVGHQLRRKQKPAAHHRAS